MISLDQPLDLNDPDAPAFLAGIQGNILKSHGRKCANLIFLRFGTDMTQARAWIAAFARTRVTSAQQQRVDTDLWRQSGRKLELPFVGFALSFDGYAALGIPETGRPADPPRQMPRFRLGMKRRLEINEQGQVGEVPGAFRHDPPVTAWQADYQGPIHALIILANNDQDRLEKDTQALVAEVTPWTAARWVERGDQQHHHFPGRSAPVPIEHFGFQDGISDPQAILQDAERERAERGSDKWDPGAPLELLLAREPGEPERYGSFLAYRKLEQNVRSFQEALSTLAEDILGLTGEAAELAGAMAVGRFRDGRPIIPPSEPEGNNFLFTESDPNGQVCPFQAHIRKSNPRGESPLGAGGTQLEEERKFRIARRGITYGERPDLKSEGTTPPEAGVGLLFMSYQAGLRQFGIQQETADENRDFPRAGDAFGVDAVYGQNPDPIKQEWPIGSGKHCTMANHVRMLGGEYFFAPSMGFLQALDSA